MTSLPDDEPVLIEPLDQLRVVLRFAEYVDHRRTQWETLLRDSVRNYSRIACDVSACVEIDSDWLTLLADLGIEARESGKRLALVGLSPLLKKSADVLGLSEALDLVDTVEEVWA